VEGGRARREDDSTNGGDCMELRQKSVDANTRRAAKKTATRKAPAKKAAKKAAKKTAAKTAKATKKTAPRRKAG